MNVFLTGASSGIGAALATFYAARGATLGLFARRETELKLIAATLEPADVRTYAGDVREAAALSAAARDFIASVGVPDVVIASAGVSRGTLTSYAEDLPGFHRHADDRGQSLSDAVPDACRRCGTEDSASDRAQEALLRIAVADGRRRARAEGCAAAAL